MVPVSAPAAWALLCGLTFGTGLWLLVSMAPRLTRPRLVNRIAPYLVDVSSGARELVARRPADPLPLFGVLFTPVFTRARELLGGMLGGAATIQLRLRQAGSPLTVEAFRSHQLVWGLGGVAVGVLASVGIPSVTALGGVAVVGLCGALGVMAGDLLLQRAARGRLVRLTGELPTVLEFLTLSLSAGEGILDAVRRVARISRGELATELSSVVADVNAGMPFAASLTRLAAELRLPALSRSVEQITAALERGTPLADVLSAQSQDARDEAKRALLELAGKKEVAMMVPLVFLILPMTIIFAIFPGIFVLQFGF